MYRPLEVNSLENYNNRNITSIKPTQVPSNVVVVILFCFCCFVCFVCLFCLVLLLLFCCCCFVVCFVVCCFLFVCCCCRLLLLLFGFFGGCGGGGGVCLWCPRMKTTTKNKKQHDVNISLFVERKQNEPLSLLVLSDPRQWRHGMLQLPC